MISINSINIECFFKYLNIIGYLLALECLQTRKNADFVKIRASISFTDYRNIANC